MSDWQVWLATISAVVAAVYTVLGYYRDKPMYKRGITTNRRPYAVMGVLLLLTWAAVGWDYYDRHYPKSSNPGNNAWDDAKPLDRVYGSNRVFRNETVVLDGRLFIDPIFENVTFVYNGTGPFGINNPQLRGTVRLMSTNKVVTQTMEIDHLLAWAEGCHNEVTIDLGPQKSPPEGIGSPKR